MCMNGLWVSSSSLMQQAGKGRVEHSQLQKPLPLLCSRGSCCTRQRPADWSEGPTLPVDRNNNGCTCSTRPCAQEGWWLFFPLTISNLFLSWAHADTRARAHTHTLFLLHRCRKVCSSVKTTERRPVCFYEFQSHVRRCIGNVVITWAPRLITGNPVSELSAAVITSPASFQPACLNVNDDCCNPQSQMWVFLGSFEAWFSVMPTPLNTIQQDASGYTTTPVALFQIVLKFPPFCSLYTDLSVWGHSYWSSCLQGTVWKLKL